MNDSIQRIPMTQEGCEQLKKELHELKTVDRPQVIKAIAEAREHGDLRENAEYDAAKDQQGHIEARIRWLDSTLQRSQVIDVSSLNNNGKVIFGSTVTLLQAEEDANALTVQIVGDHEANFENKKISYQSPIARACIGKSEGDIVLVRTPEGDKEYEIDSVEYI